MGLGWLWCVTVGSPLVTNAPWCWMILTMGEAMCVRRYKTYGKTLYLLLNYVMNLKLLWKMKSLKKRNIVLSFLKMNSIPLSGFPSASVDKESTCNAGDMGSIPGSGRWPREGKWQPTPVFLHENPMDRGAWWATVQRAAKSRTGLSDYHARHIPLSVYTTYSSLHSSRDGCRNEH